MADVQGMEELPALCRAPLGTSKPVIFRGALHGNPEEFFGEVHIQQLLANRSIPRELFRDQIHIKADRFPEEYMPEGIARNRATGAPLLIRGVQRLDNPVRGACLALAEDGWPTVHAVALETPAGMEALERHWDCNPVLAVQTRGRKRWTVYRPVEGIDSDAAVFDMWKSEEHGQQGVPSAEELRRMDAEGPADEVVLEPGDAYFVPQGWSHSPMAVAGTSLHVSICPLPQAVFDEFGTEDHDLEQVR